MARPPTTRSSYGTPTANGYVLQTVSRSGTTYIYTKNLTAATGSTVKPDLRADHGLPDDRVVTRPTV